MALRRRDRVPAAAALLVVAVVACPRRAPPPRMTPDEPPPVVTTEAVGVFHELKPGETLWGLASRYGVDVDELVEVNGIQDPRDLKVGRLIFIPDVDSMTPEPQAASRVEVGAAPATHPAPPATQGTLRWPVDEGVLYSGFGLRQGVKHDGIDLGAPAGVAVRAAADGEVLYVGFDRAFGHLVILGHTGDLVTVYAHNQDLVVTMGQRVRAGDVIAHLGTSGRSQGPHLHFEVRHGRQPVDPLDYLPED